jgi:hypothetical protein
MSHLEERGRGEMRERRDEREERKTKYRKIFSALMTGFWG